MSEKQEACQLYIEQQIDEGFEKGWTPYQIGKEVAEWVQKLFEVKLKPKTIAKRAERQLATNVASGSTPENCSGIEENQEIKWGGSREGAGRPLKFSVKEPAHGRFFTGDYEWYTPL